MGDGSTRPDSVAFDEIFAEHAPALLAYALRRCPQAADAEDAVAETFTIAWRRFGQVPSGESTRPWLYGVCRRVLANHRRGEARRWRLLDRLAQREPPRPSVTEDGAPTGPAIEALGRLRGDEQELLRLLAWERLRHAEIATVLGISVNAVAIRIHRARARFEVELQRGSQEGAPKGLVRSRTSTRVTGRLAADRARETPR